MDAQRESASRPLKESEKWLFSAGTMATTMQTSIMNTYQNYFFTNIVMLSTKVTGIITVLGKFFAIAWTPFKSVILTKKSWKGGKYSTYLRFFAPIACAVGAMMYVNVQASLGVQMAYYLGLYLFQAIVGSFTETAQIALMPLLTKDQNVRMELTSKRSTIATFGQVLYALLTTRLVTLIGKGDMGKGYLVVYVMYTVLAVFFNINASRIAKPYDLYPVEGAVEVKEEVKEEKEKFSFKDYMWASFGNPALLILFFGDVCKAFASIIYMNAMTYYVMDYIQDFSGLANFYLVCNCTMLVGSYLAYPLAKRIGKKACNTLAYAGFAAGLIAAYFVGVGKFWGVTTCIGAGRFFSGLNASLSPAMYSDIGDFHWNRSGKRMHAFCMTFFSLNFSIATLFTSAVVNGCLGSVGYVGGQAATPEIKNMELMLNSLIPGIPLAVATVASLFYPLTEKKMEEVHAEMKQKGLM